MSQYICRGFRITASALMLAWAGGAMALSAAAQGVHSEPLPEVKAPAQKTKPSSAKGQDAQGGASQGGGDQALRQRVEQLEEQLVDLQVVIGTLESLARSGGVKAPQAPAGSMPMSGSEEARLDSMETQIRALTAQIEQLSSEVRAQSGRRSEAPGKGSYADNGAGSGDASVSTSRFGSTTVTSNQADPIGSLVAADQANSYGNPASSSPGSQFAGAELNQPPPAMAAPDQTQTAAFAPSAGGVSAGGVSAKQLYETAYGYLLQQNYSAAQAGFADFLKTYPKDGLAPNALYWLGETHYVQRNFADAAEAFDLVVSTYGSSNKAADAQLKRGMSLAQLGKKQDACTAFRELATKFPTAPALLKSKADGERQRAGCT